jgi:hypothetical protein
MWGVPLPVVIAAAVVLLLLLVILRPRKPSPNFEKVSCGCGWSGEVSRYAGKCPKCNASLGEQRGRTSKYR